MSGYWHVDPRSVSTEEGMKRLPDATLRAMARGLAGESASVIANAAHSLRKRQHMETVAMDETTLSPYEQQQYRSKGVPLIRHADGCFRLERTHPKKKQTISSREERRKLFIQSHSPNKAEREAARFMLSPKHS